MKDQEIQDYIDKNMFHEDGTPMIDVQCFYEGAKWMRDNILKKTLNEYNSFLNVEYHSSGFDQNDIDLFLSANNP